MTEPDPLLDDTPSTPLPPPDGSGTALAAMILGLLAIVTCVTSLPAVICGHIALSEIRKSGGKGRGQAITGLVLGYVFLVLLVLVLIVPFVLIPYSLEHYSEPECSMNVRRIVRACETYAANNDGRYPESLDDLHPYLSSGAFVCPVAQFNEAIAGNPDPDPTYEIVFQGSNPGPDVVVVRENEARHQGKRVVGLPGGITRLSD